MEHLTAYDEALYNERDRVIELRKIPGNPERAARLDRRLSLAAFELFCRDIEGDGLRPVDVFSEADWDWGVDVVDD